MTIKNFATILSPLEPRALSLSSNNLAVAKKRRGWRSAEEQAKLLVSLHLWLLYFRLRFCGEFKRLEAGVGRMTFFRRERQG